MSVITIKNDELTIGINTYGAELTSVKDSNGKEYIWQGDVNVWKDQAPTLFPVVGRVTGGKYNFDGKTYEMKAHGFARNSEFEVEEASDNHVTFALFSNEETKKVYPFDFEFRVHYTLNGKDLTVEFETKNKTNGNMYYSAGAHEGYAIDGGIENYSIVFDENETISRYEVLPDGTIGQTPIPCLENSRELKLDEKYFSIDAIIFYDIKTKGVSLRDDRNGKSIHVSYPDCDTLLIWREPYSKFVCIEPWAGIPDAPWLPYSDLSQKPGIRTLNEGKTEIITHTISF